MQIPTKFANLSANFVAASIRSVISIKLLE